MVRNNCTSRRVQTSAEISPNEFDQASIELVLYARTHLQTAIPACQSTSMSEIMRRAESIPVQQNVEAK